MVREEIDIVSRGWKVIIFLNSDEEDMVEITTELVAIGCTGANLATAINNISKPTPNRGLLYSNPELRRSIMVVSITSSAGQFFNSISHELVHLAVHICMADSVPLHTEELCYLVGDTAHRIFPKITRYICTCGRCEKKKE